MLNVIMLSVVAPIYTIHLLLVTEMVALLSLSPWASWKHTGLFLCVVSLGNESRQTYGLLIIAYLQWPSVVDDSDSIYTCLGSLGSMKTYRTFLL
jgi:hypothetical protein